MAKEAPFVPVKPTAVLTATVGTATVKSMLFGPVSQARYDQAKRDARHRAEQLDETHVRAARLARERRDNQEINSGWRNSVIDQYENWNA